MSTWSAARAPRDAAWIAEGVIADEWMPVSPVDGRLDAFRWGRPAESIAHHGADIVPPPDPEDAVLADFEEKSAAPLPAPLQPSATPSNKEPAPDEATQQPTSAMAAPEAQAEAQGAAKAEGKADVKGETKPARPAPTPPPTEVIFPLPAAPDDPGPEPEPKPRGFRLFG